MKLPFEQIQREILVKKEITTDEKYGKKPEERTIEELLNNGVICINKPDGPSSHNVGAYVKNILKINKAGHGGTLDPAVTGVLPVSLGKATRIMEALLKAGKEYICLMHIHTKIPISKIHSSSKEFIGRITQLPPVKSAVKRELRKREVYYLEILEIKNQDVLFIIGCQAGTYIRRICDDWGKALGTKAHMAQLIRTKAGPFNDSEWHSLYELKDAYELYKQGDEKELRKIIKPTEYAVSHLPKIFLTDSAVDTICHGANLSIPGISKIETKIEKEDYIALFTLKNELVGLGTALMSSEEIMKNQKGLAVKTSKIFMEPETYPHYKKIIIDKE